MKELIINQQKSGILEVVERTEATDLILIYFFNIADTAVQLL